MHIFKKLCYALIFAGFFVHCASRSSASASAKYLWEQDSEINQKFFKAINNNGSHYQAPTPQEFQALIDFLEALW